MARAGEGADPGDRVVDGVQAGGAEPPSGLDGRVDRVLAAYDETWPLDDGWPKPEVGYDSGEPDDDQGGADDALRT